MYRFISYLENKTIFNQRLAIARTLLAICSLLLLIFNNTNELINENILIKEDFYTSYYSIFKDYSIFNLFNPCIAKYLSIVILLFVITGYFPKVSIFLQAWVHLSICNSFIVIDGGDQIASNLSLLLIPICLFDNRTNQWKEETKSRKPINVFFNVYYFLICIQVAIIYLHAGIGKLYAGEDWKTGTCLYYWFTNNVFGVPKFMQNFYNFFTLSKFVPIFAWIVIIFEISLFACIFSTNRVIKYSFMILGILFHLAIAFTHGLISFFFSMSAALILYLDQNNLIFHFIKNKFYGINISNK